MRQNAMPFANSVEGGEVVRATGLYRYVRRNARSQAGV